MKTDHEILKELETQEAERNGRYAAMLADAKRRRRRALFKLCATLVGLGMLFGGVGYGLIHMVEMERRAGYDAWIKETGNPKHLTFEEWRALYVNCGYNGDRR